MKRSVKATNAIEAKVITDNYLKWLSPKRCMKLFNPKDIEGLGIIAYNLSYKIGAGSYYYGVECKVFTSDVIRIHIIHGVLEYCKRLKETA